MEAREVCIKALKLIGALAAGETPTADDLNETLGAFNSMVDSWATERLFVYCFTEDTHTLTLGQATYTIGEQTTPTLPDIESARPQSISPASFVRYQGADFPIAVLNDDEYRSIMVKTVQGGSYFGVWYEPTYPNGTLHFWPVPQAGCELHLWSWKPLMGTAELATVVNFPPGYRRAFEYSLAEEIAPLFDMAASDDVRRIAIKARRNVKRMNVPTLYMSVPGELTNPQLGYNDCRVL